MTLQNNEELLDTAIHYVITNDGVLKEYSIREPAHFVRIIRAVLEFSESSCHKKLLEGKIEEVKIALDAYNKWQEYEAEPNQTLKAPNKYLLNRIATLTQELEGKR